MMLMINAIATTAPTPAYIPIFTLPNSGFSVKKKESNFSKTVAPFLLKYLNIAYAMKCFPWSTLAE